MNILVRSYTETGYKPIPSIYLPEDEYTKALLSLVPACTDIVPINVDRKIIYLAHRISKPGTGWWWIGARMLPHETKEEAAARSFERETRLPIRQERLKLVAIYDTRTRDRAQKPQNIGCHMVGYTFALEVTEAEVASISRNLDEKEYDRSIGLVAFDREELFRENVAQPILDLYNHIFPGVV